MRKVTVWRMRERYVQTVLTFRITYIVYTHFVVLCVAVFSKPESVSVRTPVFIIIQNEEPKSGILCILIWGLYVCKADPTCLCIFALLICWKYLWQPLCIVA